MKPLIHKTVGALLREMAGNFPDRPAVSSPGLTWSYGALDRLTDRLAAHLLDLGIRRGTHVALWAEARPNTVAAFYALQRLGAVAVMLSTCLQAQELTELVEQSDARFLLLDECGLDPEHRAAVAHLETRGDLAGAFYIGRTAQAEYPGLEELFRVGGEAGPVPAELGEAVPEDPALLLFTSGTSEGRPKAVLSGQYSLVNGGIQKADALTIGPSDVVLCAMPMFHIFCIDVNLLASLAAGACLYLPPDRHTASILDAAVEVGGTVLSAVPSMFMALVSRQAQEPRDLSQLRIGMTGGAYCGPEQFCRIEDGLGMTLLIGLGQTEVTAGIAISHPGDTREVRSTTVGRFVRHAEGKIASPESGAPLPQGETGEICIRGYAVMMGYYGRPDLTAQVVDGKGWLHTGDLGWLDEAHNLHLAGRRKDIINRGGEKVNPAEVEAVLRKEPNISAVKVLGVPDSRYGEEVCACVVPLQATTEQAMRDRARRELARFKRPRYLLFFTEFPVTATGKLDCRRLARMVKKRLDNANISGPDAEG